MSEPLEYPPEDHTESTQEYEAPGRDGYDHNGLTDQDTIDIICFLHPDSPGAREVVARTLEIMPQHGFQRYKNWKHREEAEETLSLFPKKKLAVSQELALRCSSNNVQPFLGFTFGRNPALCDVVFDIDSQRRVSNIHFRIYINSSGVLMLQDMSTNGTMVDGFHLKGRHPNGGNATRMLTHGSIIFIPSTVAEENIQFTVMLPLRDPWEAEYEATVQQWAINLTKEEDLAIERQRNGHVVKFAMPNFQALRSNHPSYFSASIHRRFGMKWNGGEKYRVVAHLGKGAFATVYGVALRQNGNLFAAKEIEKKRLLKDGKVDTRLNNELRLMQLINHDHIVKFVECHNEPTHLYIIMEYVESGDLAHYLSNKGALSEGQAKVMSRQMLRALAYLHAQRITHRDIKPDNILISKVSPLVVKLSDFGLSKIVKNDETFLKTFCGTLLYCAPEVFPHYDAYQATAGGNKRRRGAQAPKFHQYSHSVDIWSYGAVLWYSLCLSPPFEGVMDRTGLGMFERITQTEPNLGSLEAKGISQDAVNLLMGMMKLDPAERFTEFDCLKHTWIDDGSAIPELDDYRRSLDAIVEEEDEEEAAVSNAESSLSQLSLANDHEDEEEDEGDDDLAAFLHRSNMVRPDPLTPRNQMRDPEAIPSSSVDESEHSDQSEGDQNRRAGRRGGGHRRLPQQAGAGRLFGEIPTPALASSGTLQRELTHPNTDGGDSSQEAVEARKKQRTGRGQTISDRQRLSVSSGFDGATDSADASLLGAESLVEALHMESPGSALSSYNEPRTPATPDRAASAQQDSNGSSTQGPHRSSQEVTPRPANPAKLERLITVPLPDSYYHDAPSQTPPESKTGSTPSKMPPTMHPSGPLMSPMGPPARPAIPMAIPADVLDPRARFGMLVTTTDSFAPVFLKLNNRVEFWGRNRNASLVYPDALDTRVPKLAIALYHYAPGIEQVEEDGGDWTMMPELHVIIKTRSSAGIWINGVRLADKGPDGRDLFGRVHTGDVVTVFEGRGFDGQREAMRFVCEFYLGEAADPRPIGSIPFQVLSADL